MAYNENVVTHIHLNNENTEISHPIAHSAKNDSGNIEILAEDCKLNLTSTSEIQIKPGPGEGIQIDNEQETDDSKKSEITIKTANGSFGKNTTGRTVGLKLNTAKLILDTQKAHKSRESGGEEDTFDREEFVIQFRQDKWNRDSGKTLEEQGPVQVKFKGRSFDIRCHEHGGIALQIAGQDNDNHENKIKFESDRKSEIGEEGFYVGEGGKGVEFGTFNNLHSSLYTGDYRIKNNSPIMAVTRTAITTQTTGKEDYDTQEDDFKDIPLCYKVESTDVEVDQCTYTEEEGWIPVEGYSKLEASIAELVFVVNVIKNEEVSSISELANLINKLNDKLSLTSNGQ